MHEKRKLPPCTEIQLRNERESGSHSRRLRLIKVLLINNGKGRKGPYGVPIPCLRCNPIFGLHGGGSKLTRLKRCEKEVGDLGVAQNNKKNRR